MSEYFQQFVRDPKLCQRGDLQKIEKAIKEGLLSAEEIKLIFDSLETVAGSKIPRWQTRFRGMKDAHYPIANAQN